MLSNRAVLVVMTIHHPNRDIDGTKQELIGVKSRLKQYICKRR